MEDPEVVAANGAMVFDYATEDAYPSSHVALFVQTGTEVQRVDSILAVHRLTGYQWKITSPRMIQSGDKQWACYSNLQPPEHEPIPTGEYEFQYIDAAGNETWGTFTVSYPERLLHSYAHEVTTVVSASLDDSVALYDAAQTLLFFGAPRTAWHSNEAILRDYNSAVTLRHCLTTINNQIVCLLPAEYLIEQPNEADATVEADDE